VTDFFCIRATSPFAKLGLQWQNHEVKCDNVTVTVNSKYWNVYVMLGWDVLHVFSPNLSDDDWRIRRFVHYTHVQTVLTSSSSPYCIIAPQGVTWRHRDHLSCWEQKWLQIGEKRHWSFAVLRSSCAVTKPIFTVKLRQTVTRPALTKCWPTPSWYTCHTLYLHAEGADHPTV